MTDNKHTGAIFVNDIITNVLKLNITSTNYENLCVGSKRDIFYRVVYRKMNYISETCASALKNLILEEINKEIKKKNAIFAYLKKHLSNDVIKLIEDKPDDVEKILELSISKFTNKNGEVNPPKPKVPAIIRKTEELYLKSSKYLNYDTEVAFIYLQKTIMEILKYTVQQNNLNIPVILKENAENIPQIDNGTMNKISYKSIIPKSILNIIDSINSQVVIPTSSESYKYTIESIYYNLSKVIEWFFKDFLKDELQFTTTKSKADNIFTYEKEMDNIKICSIKEMLKLGWTYEDISKAQKEIFKKYIPVRDDNFSEDIESSASKIEHTSLSRRVILNNKNELIGYWHFFPLFEDTFKKSKEGLTTADDITEDKIPYLFPGTYNVEFGAIVIDEYYRNPGTKMLLYSILECLEHLALNENVFINEIVTTSSSKKGIAFIQSIGLKYYKKNADGTANVYVGKAIDLVNKGYFRDFQSLKEAYLKEFNNSVLD